MVPLEPLIEDFGLCGVMTDDEVMSLLRELPSRHVSNPPLISISYKDVAIKDNPRHRRYPTAYLMGECNSDKANGIANILIYRQQPNGNSDAYDFKLTIIHEIAHIAFDYLTDNQRQKWYSICSHRDVRWNIAGRDPVEHFCDTYTYYVAQKSVTQDFFQDEYKFMATQVFI